MKMVGVLLLVAALVLGVALLFSAAWAPFVPPWAGRAVVGALALANLVFGIWAVRTEW